MRRKACLSTIVLIILTALFSLVGFPPKIAMCKIEPPEVDVIPSEAHIGQQVLVKAKINVAVCLGNYDVRDMQASLTFPPEGDLISGDNPVYFGNVSIGQSRTANWTLVFTANGIFDLDVNASGYNQYTGAYVEEHGYATITVDSTPPAVSILTPQNTTYPTSDILLNFTVNEATDWMGYSLDNQANEMILGNTTIQVSEGQHNLVVYANDTVGNMGASDTVWFTVDTSSPIIETPARVPSGEVEPYQEVTVSVNVTDAISGIETVILSFQNNTSWHNVTMDFNPATSLYEAGIPGQPADTLVKYKVIAYDKAGLFAVNDNEPIYYVYTFIPEILSALILLLLFAVTMFLVAFKKNYF